MKKSICIFCLMLLSTIISLNTFAQKNTLKVKGLQQKVEVLRDQWGVNHIYANNEHDLFFTQGYCAAKDRLFQFEIWRRQATGTTAEILGAREIKRDIYKSGLNGGKRKSNETKKYKRKYKRKYNKNTKKNNRNYRNKKYKRI